MHKRCSCRRPRKRCVKIESTRSNVVSVMPECVILDRCEGVCPPLMTCDPKSVEKVHVPVIYLNLVLTDKGPDVVPECSTAEVERHLKCGCACAIKKEDCDDEKQEEFCLKRDIIVKALFFPWSVVWDPLSEVRLFSPRGTAKNRFCSTVFGVARSSGELLVNARTSKASESTDRNLSAVPTGYCRLVRLV
ncbi:hypothetical protein AVEN_151470-1 [Araneus ventricosus]|uniref:Platelet-derived growth factor (PDGF) family profile domain-containing protein n=1 Tax=Araneus ventricosus TaxID=182803 RepID=A0A4Y2K9A2_ARAVE|nr:hypothetical protein AVEN_151470-1 [Araneus ventricosus]